jgi:membrane-bound lytic murein transglycosylase D
MFAEPRGGAEIAAGPTFDIDVTSFASHKTVKAYMGFFQRLARDRFEIWLGRMARYEGMVRSRFAAQGIPEDLLYLGLIESGFSNTAVSRTKAVGMWQFMPYTAKRYGLVVDQWIDERRDPFKATDAAARLLSDLNTEFGSWYLAAAAYNGGSGRVSRGLRRLQASDSASDGTFFRLSDKRYLKRETRDYVPKLIAAALIAKTPSRYGFEAVQPLQPLRFDEITVSEQTGLDVLARLADTTGAALVELNPQFFRGVTPPGKPVIVRVPAGSGTLVVQRWAELPAGERVTVIEHVVVRGETISGIARKYRVDQSLVIAANPRARPRALRIGQRLVIPVSGLARASYAKGAPRRPPAANPAVTAPAPAANPDTTPSEGEFRYHIVQRGESLWTIGRRYGVEVGDLRRWNGLAAGQVLRTGGRLLVGPAESSASPGTDPPASRFVP